MISLQFKLMLSHDGSGKGAAIVTAVAHRMNNEKQQKIQQNSIPVNEGSEVIVNGNSE